MNKNHGQALEKIIQNTNNINVFNNLKLLVANPEWLKSKLSEPKEIFNIFKRIQLNALFQAIFNSKSTQYILFELSKILSDEILSLTIDLSTEKQDTKS